MKAYCIRVIEPENLNDPNPICWLDEEDENGDALQITTNKASAESTIEKMRHINSGTAYILIEFEI